MQDSFLTKVEVKKPTVSNPVEAVVMCTVNRSRDLFCMHESRAFIGAKCNFIKITKSGLYHICLDSDKKNTISLPKYNIDMINT